MAKVLRLTRLARAEQERHARITQTQARISKRVVGQAMPHPTDDRYVWDTELRGFGVRVKSTGVRSYFVRYRDTHGSVRKYTLGRYGVLTPDEARKLAMQKLAEVARGGNPTTERRAARAQARRAQSVAQLVDRFLRDHADAKCKPRTAAEYRRLLEKHVVPALGHLAVDAVTRDDVEGLHLRMRRTPMEANRVLAALSKMFHDAEAWRLRPFQSNPCYRLKRYREQKRDRFYSDDELRKLGAALDHAEQTRTLPDSHLAALRLLALTGCRVNEILTLRWAHVDLSAGVLRLPDAKTGARKVPLGTPAIALLQSLPRQGELVVWGRVPGTLLTFPALAGTWKKVRAAAGLTNARLHDLRHTIGSYAGAAGMNAFMVRDLLGHKTLAMTGRYVSQDTSPLRRAADQVAGRVAAALAGRDAAPETPTVSSEGS